MRLVFAGTPEFAAFALDAIVAAGHQVTGVLTQPDRKAGRGMHLAESAVKVRAQQGKLPLLQPPTLVDAKAQRELAPWFAAGAAELMVVAAYGLLLPQAVLAMPRLGCINIHASLLPRWRGAAPIERALLAGDVETGISIMQMDAGLDTGAVLLQRSWSIAATDSAGTLRSRLAELGASCMLEVVSMLERGAAPSARPQPESGACYAPKIVKAEAALDFSLGASELDRRIRAFDPAPGAFGVIRGVPLKLWRARPQASSAPDTQALPPGTVRRAPASSLHIACGANGGETLIVEEMQKPGGKRLPTAQVLAGFPLAAGERFASPG